MTYRKEKLRRHWMDRPPLPTSPVPCDDIHFRWPEGVQTYSQMKPASEYRMGRYDKLPRKRRDELKLDREA